MNQNIPEIISSFNAYHNGTKLIGVTGSVTLPNLDAITEEVSGAAGFAPRPVFAPPKKAGAVSLAHIRRAFPGFIPQCPRKFSSACWMRIYFP